MKKRTAYFLTQLVVILLWVTLTLVISYLDGQVRLDAVLDALIYISFFVGLTHLFREILIRKDFFQYPIGRLIFIVISCCILFALAMYPFTSLVSVGLGILSWTEVFNLTHFVIQVLANMMLFVGWSLFYFSFHFFRSYQQSLKFEAFKIEAELNHLKSQLNPHFLFNSLNSVRALIDEDPKKAKNAITQLSGLLRKGLETGKQKLIPFSEELSTVRDYLELESIRYEERLSVSLDCPGETHSSKVPPLLVQTLVENGIKHGISKLKSGGRIELKSSITSDGELIIEILNSGSLNNALNSFQKRGYGLRNSRKRLELLFDDRASLNIRNGEKNTVRTTLRIPQKQNA